MAMAREAQNQISTQTAGYANLIAIVRAARGSSVTDPARAIYDLCLQSATSTRSICRV